MLQGYHTGSVNNAVEKFFKQIDIETSDYCAGKFDDVNESVAAGKVDDDTADGFVERDVVNVRNGGCLFCRRVPAGLLVRV